MHIAAEPLSTTQTLDSDLQTLQTVFLKNPSHIKPKIIQEELPSHHRAVLYLYLPMVCGLTYFLYFYIISWADNPLTWLFTFRVAHISEIYTIFTLTSRLLDPKMLRGTSATQYSPNKILVTHPESLVSSTRCTALASQFTSHWVMFIVLLLLCCLL